VSSGSVPLPVTSRGEDKVLKGILTNFRNYVSALYYGGVRSESRTGQRKS
jgi:hypothetical protein